MKSERIFSILEIREGEYLICLFQASIPRSWFSTAKLVTDRTVLGISNVSYSRVMYTAWRRNSNTRNRIPFVRGYFVWGSGCGCMRRRECACVIAHCHLADFRDDKSALPFRPQNSNRRKNAPDRRHKVFSRLALKRSEMEHLI